MGLLLQSQAVAKKNECPGETANHRCFGGWGKEGKLRAKHLGGSWDFKTIPTDMREYCVFFFVEGILVFFLHS